ncbi:ATP-dependent nuclease [Paenibacillus sp. OAS669]|uniref:ATP-dependent nuclease n=1 Tax=Paenibacillus sp. OAS669 TaxID=2663821 RepID=UPI0019DD6608|nr:hypothetical protein [Paenibacillus sp. OAS669]
MLGEKYHLLLEKMFVGIPNIFRFDKVYIPTLRGLRPFSAGEDVYFYRTVNDYYNGNDKENVFTGLNLYDEIRDLLLGDLTEREIVADFQKFLGEVFFHGEEIALIPSKNSDVLKVKIGREKEEAIYNLGDGIQSLIILTFPLFLNRDKNMLVFIEEPELFLHPGLQRKLLETFMEFDKNQYFISTHSNHFLDLSLDINKISIYSFNKQLDNTDHNNREKVPKFVIDNVSNENNSLLEMLGVKKSSVFLSNCTIWVEGITDRYYIRHYLDLYQKSLGHTYSNNFKEDLHFSFVEYSGGNITHWSFLDDEEESEHDNDDIFRSMNVDKVCAKLFLVTDKDSDNKFERQEKLRSKLKERYYCLECKEIENLLSKEVLMEVIAEYEKTEANELQFKRKFSYENYKNKYLGKFIDNIIVNKRRKANYGQGSGTINGKVKFCQIAIKHIQVFDDLTDEAKELTRRIYMFIKEHNN